MKDFSKLTNGVPQFATALTLAEQNNWIRKKTAIRMFAYVTSQLGYEIDVEKELKRAEKALPETDYEDYRTPFDLIVHGEGSFKGEAE